MKNVIVNLDFVMNDGDCVYDVESSFELFIENEFDYDVSVDDCECVVREEDESKILDLLEKFNNKVL